MLVRCLDGAIQERLTYRTSPARQAYGWSVVWKGLLHPRAEQYKNPGCLAYSGDCIGLIAFGVLYGISILYYIILYYVILHYIISYHIISYFIILYYILN